MDLTFSEEWHGIDGQSRGEEVNVIHRIGEKTFSMMISKLTINFIEH